MIYQYVIKSLSVGNRQKADYTVFAFADIKESHKDAVLMLNAARDHHDSANIPGVGNSYVNEYHTERGTVYATYYYIRQIDREIEATAELIAQVDLDIALAAIDSTG